MLPNVSRSKGNQTVKFGQSIEWFCIIWFRIFRIIFEEKYFSSYILLIDQISLSSYLYFEILDIMCIAIVCKPGLDIMNFKLTLSF